MTSKFTQADVERQNTKVRVGRVLASVRADGKAQIPSMGLISGALTPKTPNRSSKPSQNGYNKAVVLAYFKEMGIPKPEFEYRFNPDRKWAFDLAWPNILEDGVLSVKEARLLAVEVQGGLFSSGRHNRGAAMLKEYEKTNCAAEMGWHILHFQPSELCMNSTAESIKRALGLTPINL